MLFLFWIFYSTLISTEAKPPPLRPPKLLVVSYDGFRYLDHCLSTFCNIFYLDIQFCSYYYIKLLYQTKMSGTSVAYIQLKVIDK